MNAPINPSIFLKRQKVSLSSGSRRKESRFLNLGLILNVLFIVLMFEGDNESDSITINPTQNARRANIRLISLTLRLLSKHSHFTDILMLRLNVAWQTIPVSLIV